MSWVIRKTPGGFLAEQGHWNCLYVIAEGRAPVLRENSRTLFKTRADAQAAIVEYEAARVARDVIENMRRTEYTPPAIAIEARVKEMVKEAME